uniref:DNA-directed RNA polymerases I and III subunit RPAC1 n=1 Tax=Aceria tosichella TaxID=561515 RepID=A0A6G1S6G5_9ACAR
MATMESRGRANVTELYIEDTAYSRYPGNYWGVDDSWKAERFKKLAKVNIERYHCGRELELDIFGIAPAIANAYRRIMLAEIPTMAFEHVFINNNTSVIQDEMLAHRLGMIPIKVDPTKFDWKPTSAPPESTARNHTIVFELKVKCEQLPDAEPEKSGRREDLYKDYKVFSKHLKWIPLADQAKTHFRGKNAIRPVHQKILIAKLSKNQEIDLRLHAVKGIGRDHAKFSPVATAAYKLMPDIKLKERLVGEQAKRFKDSFSDGVVELIGDEGEAKVVNARIDSGSRNIFRHADLKDKVQYDLIKDHYIFNIESTGAIPAIDIFLQSCDILGSKCETFLKELNLCRSGVNDSSSMIECK